MNQSLVIFDLDGTLIDSRRVMTQAFATAYCETVGSGQPPLEGFFQLLGAPFPAILDKLNLPSEMSAIFREISTDLMALIEIHDLAVEAVDLVRKLGVRTAIHTGKDRERTIAILEFFGLEKLFDAIVAGDDEPAGKPAPDGVKQLIRLLGGEAEATMVVGDSPLDIIAGSDAGTGTAACLWGLASERDLRAAAPDMVLANQSELAACLSGWQRRCLSR